MFRRRRRREMAFRPSLSRIGFAAGFNDRPSGRRWFEKDLVIVDGDLLWFG
jgi:hypothetical protein